MPLDVGRREEMGRYEAEAYRVAEQIKATGVAVVGGERYRVDDVIVFVHSGVVSGHTVALPKGEGTVYISHFTDRGDRMYARVIMLKPGVITAVGVDYDGARAAVIYSDEE